MENIEIKFKKTPYISLLEELIWVLLNDGIDKVAGKEDSKSIFSILYPFAEERIADSLANLCNAEIVIIDYTSNTILFSPTYKRMEKLLKSKVNLSDLSINSPERLTNYEKNQLMRSLDTNNDYSKLWKYIDLGVKK